MDKKLIELIPFRPSPIQVMAHMNQRENILDFFYQVTHHKKPKIYQHFSQWSKKDELWKETCFEFFFQNENNKGYFELNFSFLGYWNCYHFDSYRKGMKHFKEAKIIEHHFYQEELTSCLEISVEFKNLNKISKGQLASIINHESQEHFFSEKHLAPEGPDFHIF